MVRFQKLRKLGEGEYGITLPRDELRHLGLVDEDDERVNDDHQVRLQSDGDGQVVIDLTADGDDGEALGD